MTHQGRLGAPIDVSVVIPAYRAEATLADCVASVLDQDFEGRLEVVVVISGETSGDQCLPVDPRLSVYRVPYRLSAAEARNEAVQHSAGRLLAFTDADVVVTPSWLRTLVAASNSETKAVAGSVVNGTPESAVGTVEYLVEFLDCHPDRPPRTAWHGATCNLLVPRHIWDVYGPFPEDLGGGEDTLLTVELRADRLFVFSGAAAVSHRNRTHFVDVLRHQYEFGKFTARLGRRTRRYKLGVLVRHTALAPVAAAGRVVSLYARVLKWDRADALRATLLAPGVVAALAAWGAGLFVEGMRQDRAPEARERGREL